MLQTLELLTKEPSKLYGRREAEQSTWEIRTCHSHPSTVSNKGVGEGMGYGCTAPYTSCFYGCPGRHDTVRQVSPSESNRQRVHTNRRRAIMPTREASIAWQNAAAGRRVQRKCSRFRNKPDLIGMARADDRERRADLVSTFHFIQDRRPRRVLSKVRGIPQHEQSMLRP